MQCRNSKKYNSFKQCFSVAIILFFMINILGSFSYALSKNIFDYSDIEIYENVRTDLNTVHFIIGKTAETETVCSLPSVKIRNVHKNTGRYTFVLYQNNLSLFLITVILMDRICSCDTIVFEKILEYIHKKDGKKKSSSYCLL